MATPAATPLPWLRAALRLGLGAVVSGACLYFAMRGTDWGRVGAVMREAHPLWILAVVLASAASLLVRAWRWVQLLRPLGAVALGAALAATAIGAGASTVLPLRLGELVRPALLGRRTGIGLGAALSSVVLERLLDLLFVILCFLALSLVYPLPDAARAGARALALAGAGAFAVLVAAQVRRATSERWLGAVLARFPPRLAARLDGLAFGLLDGFKALGDARTVWVVCAASACLWALVALVFLCSILALEVAVPPVPAALASVVIVAAFVFLPQAPGFVGTWQAGCVVALGLFGVADEVAVGYSLLTWFATLAFNVAAGGFFLAREGVTLRDLIRRP